MAGKNDWITWIGSGNYTIKSFIQESQTFGISRRVGYPRLKQMQWGDWVYCIYKPKKKRDKEIENGTIFARFPIDTITGLSEAIIERMAETFKIAQVSPGGMVVTRRCGDYMTGALYRIKATLEDIAEIIENAPDDSTVGMVGCHASHFEILPKPWVHVNRDSMRFFRGFSRFNSEAFHQVWEEKQGQRCISIRHSFAAFKDETGASIPMEGNAEVVKNYRRLEKRGREDVIQRANVQTLIADLRTVKLPEGNLTIKQANGVLTIRWFAGGNEVASIDMKLVNILGLKYDKNINSLVNIILGMLKTRREEAGDC